MEIERLFQANNLREGESVAFFTLASLPPHTERRIKQNPQMRERFTLLKGQMGLRYYDLRDKKEASWSYLLEELYALRWETFEIPAGKIYKIMNPSSVILEWAAVGITTNPNGVAIYHEEADNIIIF